MVLWSWGLAKSYGNTIIPFSTTPLYKEFFFLRYAKRMAKANPAAAPRIRKRVVLFRVDAARVEELTTYKELCVSCVFLKNVFI